MSFINDYSYTIRRSDKNIFYFYCKDGLFYKYYDKQGNLIKNINILDNSIKDFTMFYVSIDDDDDIYAISSFDNLRIFKCNKGNINFQTDDILKFDFQKFKVCYPYIKKINDIYHVFYYVYDREEANSSALFHMYKKDNIWHEQKIDLVNHIVLNEYKIIFIDNSPVVFYFNLVDGKEEIFCSIFDTQTWSKPIQITNTNTNKIYLDAVYKDNSIHIAYCYKQNNNYSIGYIRGILNKDEFNKSIIQDIQKNSVFMYPSFTVEKDRIYLMWAQLGRLFTCYSDDCGLFWSEKALDSNSLELEFLRSKFLSNYSEDLSSNDSTLFIVDGEISFLGF